LCDDNAIVNVNTDPRNLIIMLLLLRSALYLSLSTLSHNNQIMIIIIDIHTHIPRLQQQQQSSLLSIQIDPTYMLQNHDVIGFNVSISSLPFPISLYFLFFCQFTVFPGSVSEGGAAHSITIGGMNKITSDQMFIMN